MEQLTSSQLERVSPKLPRHASFFILYLFKEDLNLMFYSSSAQWVRESLLTTALEIWHTATKGSLTIMSLDIMEIAIYLTGFFLNIASLSLCCRKNYWNTLTNIKYLIVAQALFSLLVIWSSFQMKVVSWSPSFFCTIAPLSMMFCLSLAVFNLTILVIVTLEEITRKWQLRFSLAKVWGWYALWWLVSFPWLCCRQFCSLQQLEDQLSSMKTVAVTTQWP